MALGGFGGGAALVVLLLALAMAVDLVVVDVLPANHPLQHTAHSSLASAPHP